jgi:hypothetical protein
VAATDTSSRWLGRIPNVPRERFDESDTAADRGQPLKGTYQRILHGANLATHPAEAEIILRMGTVANAVVALSRVFPQAGDSSRGAGRDLLHAGATSAAYVHAAIDLLNQRHDGLGWKLVEAGIASGTPIPSTLIELRRLLAVGSPFAQRVKTLRDSRIFHVDAGPYVEWLRNIRVDANYVILTAESDTIDGLTFDASFLALRDAISAVADREFIADVARVLHALPHLVEAMVEGFISKYGISAQRA